MADVIGFAIFCVLLWLLLGDGGGTITDWIKAWRGTK